jgi:hypothetical protein
MQRESKETELSRLRNEQAKVRNDRIFGGLSPEEQKAYEKRQKRIGELEGLPGLDWDPRKV